MYELPLDHPPHVERPNIYDPISGSFQNQFNCCENSIWKYDHYAIPLKLLPESRAQRLLYLLALSTEFVPILFTSRPIEICLETRSCRVENKSACNKHKPSGDMFCSSFQFQFCVVAGHIKHCGGHIVKMEVVVGWLLPWTRRTKIGNGVPLNRQIHLMYFLMEGNYIEGDLLCHRYLNTKSTRCSKRLISLLPHTRWNHDNTVKMVVVTASPLYEKEILRVLLCCGFCCCSDW